MTPLPRHYAISSNEENLDHLRAMMRLRTAQDFSQIRSKTHRLSVLKRALSKVLKGIVLINSTAYDGSPLYPFDGVHLTAEDLMRSPDSTDALRAQGAHLIGASCHNAQEIAAANQIQCDFITLSPVLPTRCHPNATPMGWHAFAQLAAQARMPVYALGGQSFATLQTAQHFGGYGIAGITAFWHATGDE